VNNLTVSQEPEIVKGRNPEATLQLAIKSRISTMLDHEKVKGTLATYFILDSFGLDLAVALKRSNGRCSFKLLELKAFVGQRQGGVGIGNQQGQGSQIDLLLLNDEQLNVCDEFIRWIFVDGTMQKGKKRFAFFGTRDAKNAVMATVQRGKQNNLRVSELRKNLISWNELLEQLERFLIS
jgi:hypothetical protein